MSEKMTMPGDRLAASEEYIPGKGTYERDGTIFAAIVGKTFFNESEKSVQVIELKHSGGLQPGDMVLGEVTNVTNNIANVTVFGRDGVPENSGAGETGVIHISKVTESYTDDVRKEYHPGDLVRAKVAQARPTLQLSTREPVLGVLKALCSRCRKTLFNRNGKLYCADCEKNEHRKVASDFGRYSPELRE
jgi:exosome complex component CSL4